MISRLLRPVGLGMCPPSKALFPPTYIFITGFQRQLTHRKKNHFFFPQHLLLPPKLTIVSNGKEMRWSEFFSLENLQNEAQETEHARCCGECDHSVPSATHAEVMRSGNLTQESPCSVGADQAPNGLGQLVTQPIPGAHAWSEGVLGQESAGRRERRWDYFSTFWEILKGEISSGVTINCGLGTPAVVREIPSFHKFIPSIHPEARGLPHMNGASAACAQDE